MVDWDEIEARMYDCLDEEDYKSAVEIYIAAIDKIRLCEVSPFALLQDMAEYLRMRGNAQLAEEILRNTYAAKRFPLDVEKRFRSDFEARLRMAAVRN